MFSRGQGPEEALREPLLEPEVGEVGSIFLSLFMKEAQLVLVVLLVMVALLREGRVASSVAHTSI